MKVVPVQPLWWQRGVIYQIYPRSFQDSNDDGIGDLPGIVHRLDYLHNTLGVDAIWLSPFYPSPMDDFGYDVANYTDVDPIFGTLDDFDRLVDEVHARDMKIIVDFVPNHSSDQHPWFQESKVSRDNPRRDWYLWADARADGSAPNNWLSVFGGSAWEWDENTKQYYLHSFLKEQPDLNWRNPDVRAAMLDAMRFWLERDVDGFRIDVAQAIMKDPELRDNPLNEGVVSDVFKPKGEYDTQIHLHDSGHPDVHDAYREVRRLLEEYSSERPRMCVGEIHIADWAQWATYYGSELDEIHMPFNFALLNARWQANVIRHVVDELEAALPAGAWPNYVLGNHDEPRIASRVGAGNSAAAMMLILTLRGTPTLYYGDELGMQDVPIPLERMQDPWGKRVQGYGLGRDPERTPMQWDDSPNAGFCSTNVEPWLPIAADYEEINVKRQFEDSSSMLTLTRNLLTLRRASPALSLGSYSPMSEAPPECFVYLRQEGDDRRLVAFNFSDTEQVVHLEGWRGAALLSTHLDREGIEDLTHLRLRPGEGCLFRMEDSA